MSSAHNLPFSKIANNRSSGEVPSLDNADEELIDVQSIVASTGTISVFGLVSESALDDAKSVSMSSMHSSMQGSLVNQLPLHYSPRRSLSLTVQSLNTIQSMDEKEDTKIKEQELRKKDKILCKVQYVMYSLLGIVSACIVMIIWYTSWSEDKTIINGIGNVHTDINANSNDSNCQVWHIAGDGFCDDEANIADCGYDFKDCCQMESDRTICEDCFCFVPENDQALIKEEYLELCPLYFQHHLGNGFCDLNHNNEDSHFDFGDCCLEDISCRLHFFNETDYIKKYCPANPCIRSNMFCVQEELGNGLCEDYNNGPYCDYDLGDCCLNPPNNGLPTSEKHISKVDCCMCSCKQVNLYFVNHGDMNWG